MRDLADSLRSPSNPIDLLSFKVADAEEVVKEATLEEMKDRQHRSKSTSEGVATGSIGRQDASSSGFTFDIQPQPAASTSTSTSRSGSDSNGSTPHRRRSAAPTSIPNFPSAGQPRESPFSPSPTESPAGSRFTFRSPAATPPQPTSLGHLPTPSFPMYGNGVGSAGNGMQSPWHMLAASSGAPTPSLDGPGRGSPHLGSPFEKLNIGGSWSGANLDEIGSGRRASLEPPSLSLGLSTSPGKGLHGPQNGFSFGPDAKSPLGGPPLGQDNGMAVDASEASSSKKPALPPTLAMRRASLPKNHVNIHAPPIAKTSSPLASSPSPGPSTKPRPLIVGQLGPILSKPSTLVLDLRPPSSFQSSHLPGSHSLPIPSTLLRRPAFTIQKLTQMLSETSMEAVSHWRDKSDIVMVDQESGSAPDGSVLDGLAGKFAREGFTGHMWFIKGGHRAVQTSGATVIGAKPGEGGTATPGSIANGGLMAGGMGRLAFQQNSTGGGPNSPSATMRSPRIAETPGLSFRLDPFDHPASPKAMSPASNRASFKGSIDCNSSNGSSLQPANPFFDNIRQNLELSHGGITERIPLRMAPDISSRVQDLPGFLSDLLTMSEGDGADKLANQFYELELGEQRRLQAVMNWHTEDSGASLDGQGVVDQRSQQVKDREEVSRLAAWGVSRLAEDGGQESPTPSGHEEEHYFPFSITAGVERGTKNRYKNIWPYDFSRVRLGSPADDSDYINASYVQPRGTTRRYIATQGPLDATYRDFWTLIWEQDVRVIVMITKQFEGGSIKCGNYWEEQQYGSVHLKLVSQTGGEDHKYRPTTGFDFGPAASTPSEKTDGPVSHIKRVFQITHDGHPDAQPREVVQIQCVSWPDFDVPESPNVLLSLIREVDEAFRHLCGTREDRDRQDEPPVLVHCSAGVGRTGSFIVVDAILDGLRREHRLPSLASALHNGPVGASAPSRPSSSRASSGEKGVPLLQPTAERIDSIGPAIPEMEESTARRTDQQYLAESFTKHRGQHTASLSSGGTGDMPRRPSSGSVFGFSEGRHSFGSLSRRSDKISDIERSMGMPQPVTSSGVRHRTPTPLSEMANPVWEVLEGMRVQRMSLVQSLRQYVFVYRAIITGYLQLMDNERSRESSGTTDTTSFPTSATSITIPNASSSEEDIHSKRRASPTELVPDKIGGISSNDDIEMGQGGANLAKRPSFKKMRSSAVEGISLASSRPKLAGGSSPQKGSAGGGVAQHHNVAN